MISSIVVTDTFKIGVNENGKFKMGEHLMNVTDVPFVRYRFKESKSIEEIVAYIDDMTKKFVKSVHLYEIHVLDDNTSNLLSVLEDKFDNLAKFLYLSVDNEVVNNLEFPDEILELAGDLNDDFTIDRLMLKDNSTNLDAVNADRLRAKLAKEFGIKIGDIGVCSSPLSFGELCCLTAVKAREIASDYVDGHEFPLPTANHQSMNCCGCIKYHVFNSDVAAPEVKGSKGKKAKTDNIMNVPEESDGEEKDEKKKTVKKAKYAINMARLNF